MKDGITARLQRILQPLCIGLALACGSCAIQEQLTALTEEVEKLRAIVETERRNQASLKQATEMALVSATCHQEVLDLLSQVSTACAQGAEFCELTKIPLAIMEADPSHEGRFVTMMATQRHAAIYFLKGSDDPWLNTFNQQRFTTLLGQRRLRSTKILVVANVDSSKQKDRKAAAAENRTRIKEARARLEIVVKRLSRMDIPDESIVSMVFPFNLKKTEHLNPDEKEPPGALDLSSSVWIFLTNCFPVKASKEP